MEYLKVKVADIDYPDKFYRTVLVNPRLNLYQFSIYIQILIKSLFEHMSYFEDDDRAYVDSIWIDELVDEGKKIIDYTTVSIKSALSHNNDLYFIYDSGENYKYSVKSFGVIDIPIKRDLLLLEGFGDGIFEDCHEDFRDFMDGKIKIENAYCWNLKVGEKYDFFKKIIPENVNEKLESERRKTIASLKKNDCYAEDY